MYFEFRLGLGFGFVFGFGFEYVFGFEFCFWFDFLDICLGVDVWGLVCV